MIIDEISGLVDMLKNISPSSEGWESVGSPENSLTARECGIFDQRVSSYGDGTIPYRTRVMQGFSSFSGRESMKCRMVS